MSEDKIVKTSSIKVDVGTNENNVPVRFKMECRRRKCKR